MAAKAIKARPSLAEFESFKGTEIASNEEVLSQQIDWKSFSQQLRADDVKLLIEYDKEPAITQTRLLKERGSQYASMFLNAVGSIASAEPLQYLLALIDNLLSDDTSRVQYFYETKTEDLHPSVPFLRILTRNSATPFMVAKASNITSYILGAPSVEADLPELREYLNWIAQRITNSNVKDLLATISPLKNILKNSSAQEAFAHEGGVKSLSSCLRKDVQNTQLLYVILFCLWLISYNRSVRAELLRHDLLAKLIDVLKTSPRKKVVRVAFAMLRNLLSVPEFSEAMIACGLLKILPSLSGRKWTDDDLTQDISIVDDALQKVVVTLSSFEKYHAELIAGHLEWTPVHNEKFFRENIDKFSEDNYNLVRQLIGLLDSDDNMTIEVACYDLGEFSRFHADGKKVLSKFGGKKKLMERMSHPNAKVAKQALLTVQKLMVNNWESLTTASAASRGGPSGDN